MRMGAFREYIVAVAAQVRYQIAIRSSSLAHYATLGNAI